MSGYVAVRSGYERRSARQTWTWASLAGELEKTGTDPCVSPALLDVAGPRTTIRPTAGLTLLHVDHPQLSGTRLILKDLFDRGAAAAALIVLSPLMILAGVMIWLHDRGPVLFTQVWVGKVSRSKSSAPSMTPSSAPRVRYSTTACLKPITASADRPAAES